MEHGQCAAGLTHFTGPSLTISNARDLCDSLA